MCMPKTLELKKFCLEGLKKILIRNCEKVKKVSVLGEKTLPHKRTVFIILLQF